MRAVTMSSHTLPPMDPPDSDMMNCVVRMVTPMRREFGRTLDVPHFLHDFAYAHEIIEQAKSSQNAQLREYAATLDAKLFGPRHGIERTARGPVAAAPASAAPAAGPAPASAGPAPAAAPGSSEAEMRARMMSKYKAGLR
jgi:hypothetical protein